MSFTDKTVLTLLGLFCLSFLLLFPSIPLITDEISYFNRAISLMENKPVSIEADYPLGTSLLLIPWIFVFGKKAVFFSGLLYVIGSFFFLFKSIKNIGTSPLGLVLLFIFLPLQFLSRSLMSEMPSLLIVSAGLYFYFRENKGTNLFMLALLTGLSIAFRETNILLLLPLLIHKNWHNIRLATYSVLGLVLGSSLRFVSAYMVYGNPWFVKSSYSFSIQNIPENLWIYFLILFVLIPLSPVWTALVKSKNWSLLKLILLTFVILHLCYGYNAVAYSGIKNALVLNGRFFIPAIPIFILLLAAWLQNQDLSKPLILVSGVFVGTLIFVCQFTYGKKQTEHAEIALTLQKNIVGKTVLMDKQYQTSICRYINPFFGMPDISHDLGLVLQNNTLDSLINYHHQLLAVFALREENSLKSQRALEQLSFLEEINEKYSVQPRDILRSQDGLQVSIYLISN